MASTDTPSLPVVDYCECVRDRPNQAKRIVEIMEDLGFLFLDNIPGYSEDELRWCVEFFYDVMPEKKKMEVAKLAYNPNGKQFYRGYFGVNQFGNSFKENSSMTKSSFKEYFEIGKDLPEDDPEYETSYPVSQHNAWPTADEGEDNEPYEKFKNLMTKLYSVFFDAAMTLLRLIGNGLGLKDHYYDSLFAKTLSTFRVINYPVSNLAFPHIEDGKIVSAAQHFDGSVLTLLSIFDYEGLQVLKKDDSWLDVVPRKNSLVVNIGGALVTMTEGLVKATVHRVLALNRQRRSVPFFLEPSYHAMVPKHLPEDKSVESALEHPREDCYEYGPCTIQMFKEYRGLVVKNSDTKDATLP